MQNIEVLNSLKVIEKHGSIYIINKGDKVVCHVKNEEEYYYGKIIEIGVWRQCDGTYADVLFIKTEKDSVLSFHIIKVSEIETIHKKENKEKGENSI